MKRLKVFHIITRLDLGGAQQNTLYTVSHLDPARFEPWLICGRGGMLDQQALSLQARRPSWSLRFLEGLEREIHPLKDVLAFLELVNLFLSERPDVVHTHSSKAGILGRLAAAMAGVPAIAHTYHGFGFHDYLPPRRKGFYVRLERLCAGLSRALIFVSKANQDYARSHGLGDPGRYALIRSGVELSRWPAADIDRTAKKKSLGVGVHKPLISSVGNLKPQKNPGDFVSMAETVLRSFPEAEFVFVGDGPLRSRLECRILASGLGNRLRLLGWRRDVPEILAASDVFVLTSLWEGLPRALVEAMKSGLPCVCYATDGVKDLIQDGINGFSAPPGNVHLLAERVVELLKDEPRRKDLGNRASRTISEEFDIDRMVEAQERLYERLF
ncbi:MAG: glycosyltransferase family 4 protein [Elusimicrobia bacterium]|nr:glycosyltransferase family 4 protein [Elusimicrobiota bacterium]